MMNGQKSLAATLLTFTVATLTAASSQAGLLYQETFPFQEGAANQEAAAETQGWFGGNTGDPFGSNPVGGEGAISGGGPTSDASVGMDVNNNPQGPVRIDSFGFFSKDTIFNAWFYTNEYSVQSSALGTIIWDSRNNDNVETRTTPGTGQGEIEAVNTHLAFRIGTDWYVSDQGFLHPADNSTWVANSVNLSDLTFGLYDDYGPNTPGDFLPGLTTSATMQSGIASLPNGMVDAFGFYWRRPAGTNRIDNYGLVGQVPEPATMALVALGLAGAGYRRKRA